MCKTLFSGIYKYKYDTESFEKLNSIENIKTHINNYIWRLGMALRSQFHKESATEFLEFRRKKSHGARSHK